MLSDSDSDSHRHLHLYYHCDLCSDFSVCLGCDLGRSDSDSGLVARLEQEQLAADGSKWAELVNLRPESLRGMMRDNRILHKRPRSPGLGLATAVGSRRGVAESGPRQHETISCNAPLRFASLDGPGISCTQKLCVGIHSTSSHSYLPAQHALPSAVTYVPPSAMPSGGPLGTRRACTSS